MKKEKRFEIVYKEGLSLTFETYILVDKATGVQYLCTHNGYSGGVTPLLGPDGQPLLWKSAIKEGWE